MKKNIKICCISDCHGNLNFKVPESDLLLIAGDLCPATHLSCTSIGRQKNWLNTDFRYWLTEQPIKECICVAGNHDWIWEVSPSSVPILPFVFKYIEDKKIELMGLKIYGTPVQLPFNNWAFNRDEESIQKYWDNIPKGLDILLLHSPPYGILDETHHPSFASEHIGSRSLLRRIEKVRPKLVVYGHNHSEHGVVEKDGIKYVNASLVDEEYKMTRKPIMVEL